MKLSIGTIAPNIRGPARNPRETTVVAPWPGRGLSCRSPLTRMALESERASGAV